MRRRSSRDGERAGRRLRRVPLALLSGAVVLSLAAGGAVAQDEESGRETVKMLAQVDYIDETGDRSYVDASLFAAYKQVYAQGWLGGFTTGFEVGGYVKDRRKSAYNAFYRFRDDFDHVFDVSTQQVVGGGYVVVAGLRQIWVIPDEEEEDSLLQPTLGFDKYYGDYSFFSFRAVKDPREETEDEVTFVISNRYAFAADRHFTLGAVPRTDGTWGYFVGGQWGRYRGSIGRYNQFDFTSRNRTIVSFAVEFSF